MQIINGKHYNEWEVGGFILLTPTFGKQGEQLLYGELKDVMHKLQELGKIAHEENKKAYQEAREKYDAVYKRLGEIDFQLARLPRAHDIETLETKRQLSEEKRLLESNLYHLSEKVDQLYHKDFVPERKVEQKLDPAQTMPQPDDYTQTDGYKVRQIRTALGESQAQFGKRFNANQSTVSMWERNKLITPMKVLEWQPTQSNKVDAQALQG